MTKKERKAYEESSKEEKDRIIKRAKKTDKGERPHEDKVRESKEVLAVLKVRSRWGQGLILETTELRITLRVRKNLLEELVNNPLP